MATINDIGFDTCNGVAVDLFCAGSGGKAGPFFLNPGDSGLSSSAIKVQASNPLTSLSLPVREAVAPSPCIEL